MSMAKIDCNSIKNRFKEITIKLREKIIERINLEILKLNSRIAKNIKNSMNSVNG